ncbi:MAG: DUF3846 domain-containing protein [Oscillospiraceae bacterium]|nr:DUF3846 domain-containing protein [Oscillospiraceae bacterium]
MKMDARQEIFENVTVLGKPMIFTNLRIDRNTVPKGMYAYDVRHDDDMQGEPCEIAPFILVNHWGTIISNTPLDFNKEHDELKPVNAGQVKDGITVLKVEAYKKPYVKTISGSLESLQREVEGYIEVTYPFFDEVAIICNEEGKINDMPLNRSLKDENGEIYDILAGSFLVVGLTEDDFDSLNKEQLKKYFDFFKEPEDFINLNGKIIAIPIEAEKDTNNKYILIDSEKDWNYEGTNTTLKEYMEKHPPQKGKDRTMER